MKKSSTRIKELFYTSLQCSETSDENNNLALSKDDFNIFDIIKDTSVSVEDKIIHNKILNDVKKIINKLPKEQCAVLKMRYYANMSFYEIAEDCDISINTALGRMRYALINLRKIIKKEGVILSVN